jgi:cytochrome c oxidase assembly protein subunit 15
MVLVANAAVLTHRAGLPDGVGGGAVEQRPTVTPALVRWGRALVGMCIVVLLTGTLVTGSGPHSGHNEAEEGASKAEQLAAAKDVRRLPIAVHDAARLHGTMMIVFLGLTIWVLVQIRRHQPVGRLAAGATWLLTALILQGAVGYLQYFTDVPPGLVALHVLGASLVWVAVLFTFQRMWVPLESAGSGEAEWEGGIEHPAHLPDGDRVP